MARDHLLVIDQGTTSTRVIIYDKQLRAVGQAQVEVPPTSPRSGWVEHDPEALIASVGSQTTTALLNAQVRADRIAAIGITNQRETTIVWDRETGRSIAPALVWQDRRTADACDRLRDKEEWISKATGLVIDPYFSATKIAWLLDNVPDARRRAEAGELAAGTVDTLVVRHLTGGEHLTDSTNASRTLLMDLATDEWSEGLCNVFDVPIGLLPEIRPSTGDFGATKGLDYLPDGIPIRGVAGDQQASLVGQGCLHDGQAKCCLL
jgi:glycerol kinase